MYNYEIDDAIESVMDDMDEYDNYDYDDTDEFCDALESMVYDMADYLCYEQGYSEDEALEAANVYYGCALETSSQIKQVRNQARKTYNKAQKAAKRGDTYTAKQLSAQAKNLDKKVHAAKNKVDAAVNISHQQFKRRRKDYNSSFGGPGDPYYNTAGSSFTGKKSKRTFETPDGELYKYVHKGSADFAANARRGNNGASRIARRSIVGERKRYNVY